MRFERPQFSSGFGRILERRITVILLFFFIAFGALISRMFVLQIVDHEKYKTLASKQHRVTNVVAPVRGFIYATDKLNNRIPLAVTQTHKILVASPRIIENPEAVAAAVAETFEIDPTEVIQKLSKKNDSYEILAKKISLEKADAFLLRNIAGITFEEEKRRVYPHAQLGAQLIGFVSKDKDRDEGKYGLERQYNRELSGISNFFEGAKDAKGFFAALTKNILNEGRNGSHLILTIDYNIQRKAEAVLSAAYERWNARSGTALVLDPMTGKVLALASTPAFDPNEFGKEKDFSIFLNPATEFIYEAGSVIKPITMAAAVESGLVTPEMTYEDTGSVTVGGYTIKNFDGNAYGTQTMTNVLEKSLNTGAIYIARLLGKDRQRFFLEQFGFGEKSGIDLPGEVSGSLANLDKRRDVDFLTASFGQGIAMTPIQLAAAFGAIANGGVLMRPYVVSRIERDGSQFPLMQRTPEARRRVISPETAETITKMLVSVVRNGPGIQRAGIKGYFVAAKTGTAQIPNAGARGYSNEFIHSFIGYAPAFHPKFLILLKLEAPRGNVFAANTLSSAFRELAEYILNYYEIPPDER